jgi:predicted nuclease of restriction endonuclease-like (RecB) superfamily
MELLYDSIREILQNARAKAHRAVNFAMVEAYWNIGRIIVEDEQAGENRAEYGKQLLKYLSQRLTNEFGRGFDPSNLRYIRIFYQAFPIRDTLRHELTWSHYRLLSKLKNEKARAWYINETISQNWSSRALDRQISTLYYDRLLISQNQDAVRDEASEKTAQLRQTQLEFIKDPYVLEFLQIPPSSKLYEENLEQSLINHLQQFMLELGKGFAFVARQQRLSAEGEHFRDTVVRYSVLKDNQHLFASKYRLVLPTEEELKAELERDKFLIEQSLTNL